MTALHTSVVHAIDELFKTIFSALSESNDAKTVIALLHHASRRLLDVEVDDCDSESEGQSLEEKVVQADGQFSNALRQANQGQDAAVFRNAVRVYFFENLYPQWASLLLQGKMGFSSCVSL